MRWALWSVKWELPNFNSKIIMHIPVVWVSLDLVCFCKMEEVIVGQGSTQTIHISRKQSVFVVLWLVMWSPYICLFPLARGKKVNRMLTQNPQAQKKTTCSLEPYPFQDNNFLQIACLGKKKNTSFKDVS